ncbi:MAG: signal peptidase I [Butyrivibrio sp.]
MRKKYVKPLKLILDIIGISAVVFIVYLFITVLRGGIPGIFGFRFLRVVSSSMEPVISVDDCIVVKTIKGESVQVGDIITFYSRDPVTYGYPTTHRVEDIINSSDKIEFITKGDANNERDSYPVLEDNLIGIYRGKLFMGKYISKLFNVLSDKKIYFTVIILPILICFTLSIIDIVKILQKDE